MAMAVAILNWEIPKCKVISLSWCYMYDAVELYLPNVIFLNCLKSHVQYRCVNKWLIVINVNILWCFKGDLVDDDDDVVAFENLLN